MKSFVIVLIVLCSRTLLGQGFSNFSINYVNNYNTITCAVREISITVTTSYTGQVSCNWSGPTYTATGAAVTMTAPGNYSLIITTGTLSANAVVPVLINTVTPVCSPATMTFAPSGTLTLQVFTFTAVSPTNNITHYFYSPGSQIPTVSGGMMAIYFANAGGTYTYCMVDNVNGCSTCPSSFTPNVGPVIGTTTVTSLKENDLPVFTFYPNPTSSIFKVTPTDPNISRVKVYNVAGEQMKVDYVLASELSIDLGEAPNGIYIVYLIANNGKISRTKVVKE